MGKKKDQAPPPEWSHLIDSEEVEAKPQKLSISADEEERGLLAKRLDVFSIDSLKAELTVVREKGSMVVHVKGVLKAQITQSCVVTTDPVISEIEESFKAWFADPEQAVSFAKARRDKLIEAGQGELPILSEADDPEPIIEGQIDLGELVTQYLSLSINLYPHAEGVKYEIGDEDEAAQGAETIKNPFAALKDWKEKQGGGDA
ncbi:MAG: hypothetical protein DHS20C02_07200 [Micavibrio sp.]|nr:MAG: hypothetical protein DHS20C02_07200 [Micavibrio sp.]